MKWLAWALVIFTLVLVIVLATGGCDRERTGKQSLILVGKVLVPMFQTRCKDKP